MRDYDTIEVMWEDYETDIDNQITFTCYSSMDLRIYNLTADDLRHERDNNYASLTGLAVL